MLKRFALTLLVASLLVGCLASPLMANDWPQWMGPNRDGLSEETGLLQEWPESGPEKIWTSNKCGLGYSGPAVVGDTLYIMGTRDNAENLMAIDAKSGDELWATKLTDVYKNGWGDGPRGTPTVSGDSIYALCGNGNLFCLSLADGKEKWRASLTDLGGKIPTWGYSESPLVDGNLVLATPGGKEGAVIAFDKSTGNVLWQSKEIDNGAHYSSIIAAQINGQKQYVQLMPEKLIGLNPADGSLLWEAPWGGKVAVIPTPIVKGNQIYVTSGYGAGCMLVDVDADNVATVVYENKVMKNHHGGVIRLGEHVYGHSDGTGWTCQDWATGERIWRDRGVLGKGAISYADGRFYCLDEETGQLALIEPSTDGWEEHGRFKLEPQTEQRSPRGKIWTHPVIVNGRLYLRDQELLSVYDLKAI